MKKIEGHLKILQWIHTLVVTFMALITAGFILTMLENCHHFTLTESLVIEQNINLLVAGSEIYLGKRPIDSIK